MKTKCGLMIKEFLVGLFILGILLSIIISIIYVPIRNYVIGNKQVIDLNYNYNTAYIISDDNKFEKVRIKAWKDWNDSDSIQVIKLDGTPIYTHLRNVKLTKEK